MPIYIGIDWSENKHDVVFLNEAGAIVAQLTMSHTPAGLLNLEEVTKIDSDRLRTIITAMELSRESGEQGLKIVFESLNQEYPYGMLRCIQASLV